MTRPWAAEGLLGMKAEHEISLDLILDIGPERDTPAPTRCYVGAAGNLKQRAVILVRCNVPL